MSGLQQVNLLTQDVLPRRELLDSQQLLFGWSGFVVLLIMLSALDLWHSSRLEDQLAREREEVEQLQRAVSQMEQDLAGGQARLQDEIGDLTERRRTQRALALTLAAEQQQQALSRALTGLAQSTLDGLWLSEIHIMPHGLHLKGQATDAVLLPRYIQALSQQDRFSGHSFDAITMLLDEDLDTLAFELRAPQLDAGVM